MNEKKKPDAEAGLYTKASKFNDGEKYLTGKMVLTEPLPAGTYWVNVNKNNYKKEDRHPDWRMRVENSIKKDDSIPF
jgi:hypothetical protein